MDAGTLVFPNKDLVGKRLSEKKREDAASFKFGWGSSRSNEPYGLAPFICENSGWRGKCFNLETSVGREKDVQDIGVRREFEKVVVTLLVMRAFSNFLGAPRACADFREPTAVSRF